MQTENNLSFLDLVKKRRTTRKFTEQTLTQEEVVDLMKVPLLAPSSRNRQPLQYILVDNKDDLSRLSECKPSGIFNMLLTISSALVPSGKERSLICIQQAPRFRA